MRRQAELCEPQFEVGCWMPLRSFAVMCACQDRVRGKFKNIKEPVIRLAEKCLAAFMYPILAQARHMQLISTYSELKATFLAYLPAAVNLLGIHTIQARTRMVPGIVF
jgi:hypothetical protein